MKRITFSFLSPALFLTLVLISQLSCEQTDIYSNALNDSRFYFKPDPGDFGRISAENIGAKSLTLNWTKAIDNKTEQENLEYRVYRSEYDNISSILGAKRSGTLICDWIKNIDSFIVTGLSEQTGYYFNIIVKDEHNQKAAYDMAQFETTTSGDCAGSDNADIDCDGNADGCDEPDLTDADCDGIVDGCDDSVEFNDVDCNGIHDDCTGLDITDADCDGNLDGCVAPDLTDADCDGIIDGCDDSVVIDDADCDGNVDGCVDPDLSDDDCDGIIDGCDTIIDFDDIDCDGMHDDCIAPDLTDADCDGNVDGCVVPDLSDADCDNIIDSCDDIVAFDDADCDGIHDGCTAPDLTDADCDDIIDGCDDTITDENAPEVLNAEITYSEITLESVTLSWTKATDCVNDLQYIVLQSLIDSPMSSYADAIADPNVTPVNKMTWTTYPGTGTTITIIASDLYQNAQYRFNVFVRDRADNISAYDYVSVNTDAIAVYVRAGSTGDGTYGNPSGSISEGITDAQDASLAEVWVETGNYNESITLEYEISIRGGYYNNYLNRDFESSVISSDVEGTAAITVNDAGITSDTEIDGFTINGYDSSTSSNYGIEIDAGSPTILRNIIHGGSGSDSYGIRISDSSISTIANNAIHGGDGDCSFGISSEGSSIPLIVNNTINGGNGSNYSYGIFCHQLTQPYINNNIIFTTNGDDYASFGIYENTNDSNPTEILNNNLFSCTSSLYFDNPSGFYTNVTDLNSSVTGAGNNVSVDLISYNYFVDATGDDLRLVNSLDDDPVNFSDENKIAHGGINGGLQNPVWPFSTDKDGNDRPESGGWSMGAYELIE